MSDNALGSFLRQRREVVSPEEVGLPSGGRRRTPGLRRAELATLAGVSVDYLTRLEQGRDRNPSDQVLTALADTLRLTNEERMLMFKLGTISRSEEACPGVQPPDHDIRPSVRLMLAGLEPHPAVLVDRLGEVLAHTDGWARVFGDIGVLDTPPPNVVRFLFGDPRAHAAYPAWDLVAEAAGAELAADTRSDDPALASLLDAVEALDEAGGELLRRRVAGGPTVARRSGVVRLVHPTAGELRLAYESMAVPESEQRLVVHLPHDEATARALDELARERAGGLRAVTG
jgi:transcriptional regulator with XRE-family HTH domain